MPHDQAPYSAHRLTVRLELRNKPGVFASVAAVLARERANLGAVDIIDVNKARVVRDITFDARDEEHGERVIAAVNRLRAVTVISASDQVFLAHLGGKIRVQSKMPVNTRARLATVYTPGVARVCHAIAKDPSKAHTLTIKRNSVAVVSDGSAILGLGNLGPEAAIPVMEGKAMLFQEFAGIDAWPICVRTQDTDAIVTLVEQIAPVFGGINLEDISAPRCFEIERRLRDSLDIPVFHDDQHGTAIVVLAALKNALKLIGRDMRSIKVVVSGVGAAGLACCQILMGAGVRVIRAAGRGGVVFDTTRGDWAAMKRDPLAHVDREHPSGSLREALAGADVFLGVSQGNILKPNDLKRMNKNRIVFALANPDPEIEPSRGARLSRVFATGRSDLPNQINNALAFPGVFRGALDARATRINEAMKLAAANAIADLIKPSQLNSEYVIPSIFDKRVAPAVALAVGKAARRTGVARSA